MWRKYKVTSCSLGSNSALLQIGLEYSCIENNGSQRVYVTYIDNVLLITIHSEQFSGEDLSLKIIQCGVFQTVNKTIEFVNKQYNVNIPLITQEDLDSIGNDTER